MLNQDSSLPIQMYCNVWVISSSKSSWCLASKCLRRFVRCFTTSSTYKFNFDSKNMYGILNTSRIFIWNSGDNA